MRLLISSPAQAGWQNQPQGQESLFVVFTQADSCSQVPWPKGATGFALWSISSVCWTLCLNIAGLQLPGALARLSGQAGLGSPFDIPNRADLHSPPSSLIRLTTILALQINKATGWDCCLGALGRCLVYQDLGVSYCKTLPPSLSESDSQSSPADSPAIHKG